MKAIGRSCSGEFIALCEFDAVDDRGEQTVPSQEDPVSRYLARLRDELMSVDAGEVASYIPELGRADPRHFAIAIATTDGRVFAVGDASELFTI